MMQLCEAQARKKYRELRTIKGCKLFALIRVLLLELQIT